MMLRIYGRGTVSDLSVVRTWGSVWGGGLEGKKTYNTENDNKVIGGKLGGRQQSAVYPSGNKKKTKTREKGRGDEYEGPFGLLVVSRVGLRWWPSRRHCGYGWGNFANLTLLITGALPAVR